MLVYSAAITRYQSFSNHQHVQHIRLRQSIDWRTVEWQFYFMKHKLYIITVLECRVFILLFIFPYFCGWRCGMFMIEFSLKWCGFHQTFMRPPRITSHQSIKKQEIELGFPLSCREGIHCYHSRIQSFYSSLGFALNLWLQVWFVLYSRTKWS